MNPLRKITDDQKKLVQRLTILVEVLLVYIVIVTGVGGFYMLGLIDQSHHRAAEVSSGLARFICGAGLARETSILDGGLTVDDQVSNLKAAKGYFGILRDFQFKTFPGPISQDGERCPYPHLTAKVTSIVKAAERTK